MNERVWSVGGMALTGETEVLGECQFVHHMAYVNWYGIEPKTPRWETGDWPSEGW